jgi:hypothetical protein
MKRLILFLACASAWCQNPVVRELGCAPATASGTTYACSIAVAPGAYSTNVKYWFVADVANTGAATINFNSLGAKTIKKPHGAITTDLIAGDLLAGQYVLLAYDGTNMQVLTQLGGGGRRAFGYSFYGGATPLTTSTVGYLTVPFACTLAAWNISVSPADTATIDIWQLGTGTAIPTVSNTITASAVPAITTGTTVHSTTMTSWATTHGGLLVAANDVFGINIKTIGGTAAFLNLTVECDQ